VLLDKGGYATGGADKLTEEGSGVLKAITNLERYPFGHSPINPDQQLGDVRPKLFFTFIYGAFN
jgi:hypothetical protein